jgi:hypothetical protein
MRGRNEFVQAFLNYLIIGEKIWANGF